MVVRKITQQVLNLFDFLGAFITGSEFLSIYSMGPNLDVGRV